MEKVTKVVDNKSEIWAFIKDVWHDMASSFKSDLSDVLIQLSASISGLYLLFQRQVEYKQFISVSDSFVHNIIPTIVGASIYAYMMYNREAKGPSRFITFLIAITLSAYSTDFFIELFNKEPHPFYYTLGGAIILPLFQGVILLANTVKKEGPKAVWDFIKSKFNKTNNQ